MKDYYKILNVQRDSSTEKIHQKFKELALEYHPDVSVHSKAHEFFVEINEAYQILGDRDKKAVYDILYDTYFTRPTRDIPNKQKAEKEFRNFTSGARDYAHQQTKVKYEDYIKKLNCFFSEGNKSDGPPFYYYMHITTGIKGGVGPMGSIKAKTVNIPIPRSKKAARIHRLGLGIKALFLILTIIILRFGAISGYGFVLQAAGGLLLICLGGFITHLIYKLTKTRSKLFHAKKYFLVSKYRSKGYERGSHPVMSTTPIGLLDYILRWVL